MATTRASSLSGARMWTAHSWFGAMSVASMWRTWWLGTIRRSLIGGPISFLPVCASGHGINGVSWPLQTCSGPWSGRGSSPRNNILLPVHLLLASCFWAWFLNSPRSCPVGTLGEHWSHTVDHWCRDCSLGCRYCGCVCLLGWWCQILEPLPWWSFHIDPKVQSLVRPPVVVRKYLISVDPVRLIIPCLSLKGRRCFNLSSPASAMFVACWFWGVVVSVSWFLVLGECLICLTLVGSSLVLEEKKNKFYP